MECFDFVFKSEGSQGWVLEEGESVAEAPPSSGPQADSEAGGKEQEGMFWKGVPSSSLGHCYPLYPPQMIFVSFLLLEPPPRGRSGQDTAAEIQQELK